MMVSRPKARRFALSSIVDSDKIVKAISRLFSADRVPTMKTLTFFSRFGIVVLTTVFICSGLVFADEPAPTPKTARDWSIELVAQAPDIVFPTAIVVAPDGTVYLGQDPMDMPGPPTEPIDSIVAIKNGKISTFATGLWAVMGLEWIDGTLYVVHPPYLSALTDTDGDGKADRKVDLVSGLGPKLPGFNGINDHVVSGTRLSIDGYLYISVGDKGIPRAVGKDGAAISLHGGGVIRVRPDGTGLEVVSTGERNPLSVGLTATGDVFTYGNDDDGKQWPNSLTHHIMGGHYGYPYDFLLAPTRRLPIVAGQIGGSGTQMLVYNEGVLPRSYRGDLFVCDWGLSRVDRIVVERSGASFRVKLREAFVTAGKLGDFRPFSLAVGEDGGSMYLVDWAYNGWLADGPKTGRLYRLRYTGADLSVREPRPKSGDQKTWISLLDDSSQSVRLAAQRELVRIGAAAVADLNSRLANSANGFGAIHAIWALDAIDTPDAAKGIRAALGSKDADIRAQAAKSAGIRRDKASVERLIPRLKDVDARVRLEAAIALGRIGDKASGPALFQALGDEDEFVDWSIRRSIRSLAFWDREAIIEAINDPRRTESTLRLTDEAFAVDAARGLAEALPRIDSSETRARVVMNLSGQYLKYPEWKGEWFGTNPLAGLIPRKTSEWDRDGMAWTVKGMIKGLSDPDAKTRAIAVAGLGQVRGAMIPLLRTRLAAETDPLVLQALVSVLAADSASIRAIGGVLKNRSLPIETRKAALAALEAAPSRDSVNQRFMLVFQFDSPPELVALALPGLGRAGALPPNDLLDFLKSKNIDIRIAALRALETKGARPLPAPVKSILLEALKDPDERVRDAAIRTIVVRDLIVDASPRLIELANDAASRSVAIEALATAPEPSAISLFLKALSDRDPSLRRSAQTALESLRDRYAEAIRDQAKSITMDEQASITFARILAHFEPIVEWRVIGPFPRTTAQVFLGDRVIDMNRTHVGAEGRKINWVARKGDPKTGRLVLDDLKGGAGDRGGFGYDKNGSPDLCAFAYAEIDASSDRDVIMLFGSSGTINVTLNEKFIHSYYNFSGRSYAVDSGTAKVRLEKGRNRLLVQTRQGIGTWSFSVQVSEPIVAPARPVVKRLTPAELAKFALAHKGDASRGAEIFFDTKGIGCVKCHAAGGRGTANVGPDLTGLALKYDTAEIIRSVLEPSNRIATGYQPVVLATTDGKVLTGLVRNETALTIEIVDSNLKTTVIPKSEIDERKIGAVSIMPVEIAERLTPLEFTDLIEYLKSLKAPAPTPADQKRTK